MAVVEKEVLMSTIFTQNSLTFVTTMIDAIKTVEKLRITVTINSKMLCIVTVKL